MVRALWNGEVIAEGDDVVQLDGYTYFRDEDVRWDYLTPSEHTSICAWKGEASYFTLHVDGAANENAAWRYREPSDAASVVRGRIGFWRGVEIER